MTDAALTLVILGAVIVLFVINRLPVGVVAIGTALALWATGLVDLDEALAGFGDPVVMFIATLLIVSEAIDSSGLTAWAGERVAALAGDGLSRLLVAVMALCALLTSLISLNGSVAALLPMAVMLAMRSGQPPSRLLMPMVYGGSAGSLLVLMGSPVNVIVADAARDAGEGAFGFFEFTIIGLPLLAVTIAALVVLAPQVLPVREPLTAPPDLSRHATILADHYDLRGGFYRLRVRTGSALLGRPVAELGGSRLGDVEVVAVQSGADDPRPAAGDVAVDDVLVVLGEPEDVSRVAVDLGLAVAMTPLGLTSPGELLSREAGVAEVVVPPRSPLVGETVFPGMRRAEDLVVLAIQRYGRDLGDRPVEVAAGDSMLVYGAWPAIGSLVDDRDVLVVDSPDLLRRQAAPLGTTAARTGATVAAMVALLAFGIVPPAVAGMLAVIALVLSGVLSSAQAYRAVSWEMIVLIAGLIPLTTAIQTSGAADEIAQVVLRLVGDGSPVVLMVALFVLTGVLGLVISNTATVLIMVPIAMAAAAESGVAARPILMLTAVAGSASLLTPVQTPGNMMVMAPAGYRFSDYCRLGLPLLVLWLLVAILVIPLVWPFA